VLWWKHVEGRVNNKNQNTGKDETYPMLPAREHVQDEEEICLNPFSRWN
jgi:hypothetical protein